jgi:hypothetical protein
MSVVEEEQLVDLDRSPSLEVASATQQLLDELLGRFEEDDLPMFLHGHSEFCPESEE